MHVVPFTECTNSGHRHAHLGPKPGQDQLPAAGSFHEVHNPFVLPCVDVRPIDRLLIWKYFLKTLYDSSAASFDHRRSAALACAGACFPREESPCASTRPLAAGTAIAPAASPMKLRRWFDIAALLWFDIAVLLNGHGSFPTFPNCDTDVGEEIFCCNRLFEIAKRAGLQRSLARGLLGVGRDENGGKGVSRRNEVKVQCESVRTRHAHVRD